MIKNRKARIRRWINRKHPPDGIVKRPRIKRPSAVKRLEKWALDSGIPEDIVYGRTRRLSVNPDPQSTVIRLPNKRFSWFSASADESTASNSLKRSSVPFGQRFAESIANFVGSWRFLVGQTVILTLWVILNVIELITHWDPYPFILMNLFLSMQAAYTAPMILIAQNRQAEADRRIMNRSYAFDRDTHKIAINIHEHLTYQDDRLDLVMKNVGISEEQIKELDDEIEEIDV